MMRGSRAHTAVITSVVCQRNTVRTRNDAESDLGWRVVVVGGGLWNEIGRAILFWRKEKGVCVSESEGKRERVRERARDRESRAHRRSYLRRMFDVKGSSM